MVFVNFCPGQRRAMMARQPQMLQMSAVATGQMSPVETGQMSAAETGQMSAEGSGFPAVMWLVQSQAKPKSWPTKVPVGAKNIKFGPK